MIGEHVLEDRSCLSWWFPKVQAAGLPVPKTEIVKAPDLSPWLKRKNGEPFGFDHFFAELRAAAEKVGGYPVFLRTGQGSGKHEWKDTCFVPDEESFPPHVAAIFEWSHLVDIMGLPVDVWVVRELLKTEPEFYAFQGMPVTKERRYFVRDGETICRHPYWPEGAFNDYSAPSREDWKTCLAIMNAETAREADELTALSRRVAKAVPGFWSVDWLWTRDRGWVLIDMAEGEKSFHWPGCKNGARA